MRIKYLIAFLYFIIHSVFNLALSQQCNNWLRLPDQPSFVRIGDLDITGDKVTVEAVFNRTAPWSGIDLFQGDLVSKHEDPKDVNYLLRPSSAEITTNIGYYKTPTICPIELNKTYHAAMVYDGKTLKFYRNGFLMSQVAATGNLVTNNWQTQIGLYFNQLTKENFIGYINEVRIWNIARSQDQIKSFMNQSLPNPAATPGLLAYYTFDNLSNKQGNTAWNGKLGGNATINQTNSNCSFVIDSCGKKPCEGTLNPDFQFERDICSPKTIKFSTKLSNIKSYHWDFGNGQKVTGQANPIVVYSTNNSYNVKLKVESNDGCLDSIEKPLSLKIIDADIIKTADTSVCLGDNFSIRTNANILNFCWQATNNQIFPTQINPNVTPSASSLYTLTIQKTGDNLVRNGDFSRGNADFNSSYIFSSSGLSPGVYHLGKDIQAWNAGMVACNDHTTGDGNMMMVNGTNQLNKSVWAQTINIKPNTDYAFVTWLQNITTLNPARLQFKINGVQVGNIISANTQSCIWDKFYVIWNSGANTSALIEIINMNQDFSGNAFALDDIFFGELTWETDFVNVKVNPIPEIDLGKDTAVCEGASLHLTATISQGSNITWSPASYLSSTTITNPVTTPLQTVTYLAVALNPQGCFKKDTLNVQVVEPPSIEMIADTAICEGETVVLHTNASHLSSFQWQPVTGLSDPLKLSPAASPKASTIYTLTVTNNGCQTSKAVSIGLKSLPSISISNDTTICDSETVRLNASGGISYKWTPAAYLSSDLVADPVAAPISDMMYKVEVSGLNGCTQIDSLSVFVRPKPSFSVYPLDTSVCNGDTALLIASGGDHYKWIPIANVLSPNSARTFAVPMSTTSYQVIIEDVVCRFEDTLTAIVNVLPKPKLHVQKSNDIDCNIAESRLSVAGANRYIWESVPSLSGISTAHPIAIPRQTTTYYVEGTSIEGCSTVDCIEVKVLTFEKNNFYLPSAFTPNHDNLNDCFGIKYWGVVLEFSMNIYNRWGELIFSTKNPADCWNGKYKGVDLPVGMYVYMISAKTLCGDISKKGTISLLR